MKLYIVGAPGGIPVTPGLRTNTLFELTEWISRIQATPENVQTGRQIDSRHN